MKAINAKKQTNIYRKPGLVWLKSRFFPWTVRVQQINQNSSQIQSREDTM